MNMKGRKELIDMRRYLIYVQVLPYIFTNTLGANHKEIYQLFSIMEFAGNHNNLLLTISEFTEYRNISYLKQRYTLHIE